jgi:predicted RNase H-like HicB family nuclease
MFKNVTLEYWMDDDWYIGRLQEVPGVFSQGRTLDELRDNIQDAYRMVMEETGFQHRPESKTMEIEVSV